MATPQAKTTKILNLIDNMKRVLRENNDIQLCVWVHSDTIEVDYTAVVRRDYPMEVAKRYKNNIDKFVEIFNETNFSKGNKLKKVNVDSYLNEYGEDEYSEYEIEVGQSFQIKLGKNQSKFFDKYKQQ